MAGTPKAMHPRLSMSPCLWIHQSFSTICWAYYNYYGRNGVLFARQDRIRQHSTACRIRNDRVVVCRIQLRSTKDFDQRPRSTVDVTTTAPHCRNAPSGICCVAAHRQRRPYWRRSPMYTANRSPTRCSRSTGARIDRNLKAAIASCCRE